MGLLSAPFILATRGTLALANIAHAALWRNRSAFGRAFTLVAGLTAAGVAIDMSKDDGIPQTQPGAQIDSYYNGTDIRTPATPGAQDNNGGGNTVTLQPGSTLPRSAPEIIADTYLQRIYDPKTAQWLGSLPENERAARTAEVAAERALLRDAITKYESIVITPEMTADYQREIIEMLRAENPGKDDEFLYTMIPGPDLIEMRLRGRLLTELHPELRVNEEQGAALDQRLRQPAGTHFERQVSIIAYYTDSPEARERGLRSYNIDRDQVIEKANENIIIEVPQRQGALRNPLDNGTRFG